MAEIFDLNDRRRVKIFRPSSEVAPAFEWLRRELEAFREDQSLVFLPSDPCPIEESQDDS